MSARVSVSNLSPNGRLIKWELVMTSRRLAFSKRKTRLRAAPDLASRMKRSGTELATSDYGCDSFCVSLVVPPGELPVAGSLTPEEVPISVAPMRVFSVVTPVDLPLTPVDVPVGVSAPDGVAVGGAEVPEGEGAS